VRGIAPRWELADELPPVLAEPNRLEQVVINLLLNARDAIEDRWAGNKENPDKRVLITSAGTPDKVVFRICDTGEGIPPAIRERLFEPFFTTKNVGKGTGLGLSISYGIVTDYGGDIRASSWDEGGACFEITFPRAECEL
jgi:histidine kinase